MFKESSWEKMRFKHITKDITQLSLRFMLFAFEVRRFYSRPKPKSKRKTLQCFSVTWGDHVQQEDCNIPAAKSSDCGCWLFADRQ